MKSSVDTHFEGHTIISVLQNQFLSNVTKTMLIPILSYSLHEKIVPCQQMPNDADILIVQIVIDALSESDICLSGCVYAYSFSYSLIPSYKNIQLQIQLWQGSPTVMPTKKWFMEFNVLAEKSPPLPLRGSPCEKHQRTVDVNLKIKIKNNKKKNSQS